MKACYSRTVESSRAHQGAAWGWAGGLAAVDVGAERAPQRRGGGHTGKGRQPSRWERQLLRQAKPDCAAGPARQEGSFLTRVWTRRLTSKQ